MAQQQLGANLTLTFTHPNIANVIGSPSGNTLTGNSRDNQFTVSDGTASSGAATQSIIVTPIPPTTANHTVTIVEGSTYTFTGKDFPFTDPLDTPANGLAAVYVVTLPLLGTLTDNGVAVTPNQRIPLGDITGGKFQCAIAQMASDSIAGAWGFVEWDQFYVPIAVLLGMTLVMMLFLTVLLKRRDPV